MKTILITCIRGLIARNILGTDAFSLLKKEPGLRIVVAASAKNIPVLEREFGGTNVVFEPIELPSKEISGAIDRFLWIIATNLLATRTRAVQRRVKLATDGNWFDAAAAALVGYLGRSKAIRHAYRWFARVLSPGREFEYLFERHRPDLFFATDVYTLEDVKMMRLAARRGVRTVGMVRSWDNITSKTLLSFIPERMVANGGRIRDELVRYGDVPAERIFITGVPHYDHYRPDACMPRHKFLAKLGFDERKKLVLFATPSDHYLQDNMIAPLVVEALGESGANVLVRPPLVGRSGLEGRALPANVRLDDPGDYGDFVNIHMTPAADRHLADSLNAADIVITWASTMIIDAVAFGKPVILIGFDDSPRPYHRGILRYYDYEHHQFILASGGVQLARNPEELRRWVDRYLEDPRLDEAGRRKIVEEYCGSLDGRSGARLGEFLVGQINADLFAYDFRKA